MTAFTRSELSDELHQFVETNVTDGDTIDVAIAWDVYLRDEVPTLEHAFRADQETMMGRALTDVEVTALSFGMSDGPWWVAMHDS